MLGRLTDTENLVYCVRLKCRQGMLIRFLLCSSVQQTSTERQEGSIIASA